MVQLVGGQHGKKSGEATDIVQRVEGGTFLGNNQDQELSFAIVMLDKGLV